MGNYHTKRYEVEAFQLLDDAELLKILEHRFSAKIEKVGGDPKYIEFDAWISSDDFSRFFHFGDWLIIDARFDTPTIIDEIDFNDEYEKI